MPTEVLREENRTPLMRYEAARAALAEAVKVDEVLDIRSGAERLKLYGRQAKDKTLVADAQEILLRAERKLGVMIQSAKETGVLGVGRPSKSNVIGADEGEDDGDTIVDENHSEPEAFSKTTLKEAGIDPKLSSQAQKWARMGDEDFDAELERTRNRILSGGAKTVTGSRSIMANRQEAIDSLDFFPTPPWATRALVEDVLPQLGVSLADAMVWEPACGEGHIVGVLAEYAGLVCGTDIFDYSIDGRAPPYWLKTLDFLNDPPLEAYDWVITNPPFDDKAVAFVQRALEVAKVGVAMFFRSQWAVEGVERYDAVFRDHPPTLPAWFVERVNLCKGRWDPDGSTATAYCWLVWLKGEDPRPQFHIPPGRREARWHDGDVERFTAHPVAHRGGNVVGEGADVDPALSPVLDPEAKASKAEPDSGPRPVPDSEASRLAAGRTAAAEGDAPSAPLGTTSGTIEERDAVIHEVYGREGVPVDFAEIEQRTGLDKVRARKRAYQLDLTSRDRQKAAVIASNKARVAE